MHRLTIVYIVLFLTLPNLVGTHSNNGEAANSDLLTQFNSNDIEAWVEPEQRKSTENDQEQGAPLTKTKSEDNRIGEIKKDGPKYKIIRSSSCFTDGWGAGCDPNITVPRCDDGTYYVQDTVLRWDAEADGRGNWTENNMRRYCLEDGVPELPPEIQEALDLVEEDVRVTPAEFRKFPIRASKVF